MLTSEVGAQLHEEDTINTENRKHAGCCRRGPPTDLMPCEHFSPRGVWRLPPFTPAMPSLDTAPRSVGAGVWGPGALPLRLCKTLPCAQGAFLLQQGCC